MIGWAVKTADSARTTLTALLLILIFLRDGRKASLVSVDGQRTETNNLAMGWLWNSHFPCKRSRSFNSEFDVCVNFCSFLLYSSSSLFSPLHKSPCFLAVSFPRCLAGLPIITRRRRSSHFLWASSTCEEQGNTTPSFLKHRQQLTNIQERKSSKGQS